MAATQNIPPIIVRSESEEFSDGASVVIMGRSAFAGCRATVIERRLIHGTEFLIVTFSYLGRLYENVPFLPTELYPLDK